MLGAREHYAPVVMAEKAGWLRCFITDLWSPWGKAVDPFAAKFGLDLLRRSNGRYSQDIPSNKVRALTLLGLQYKWMRSRAKTRVDMYSVFEQMGSRFAEQANTFLSEGDDAFLGFTSASLETLRHASRLGIRTVLDQIDPCRTEYAIVAEEEKRFPELAKPMPMPPESYFARIEQEWEHASTILVNSSWSKKALQQQGIRPDKLMVAPLAFHSTESGSVREPCRKKLRVLWLGTLCLRKGFPYALAAAERLAGTNVEFTFAGPCDLQPSNLHFPPNARYAGPVTRSAAFQLYRDNDVFLFPTLSDGFGLTQLEALAYGLPVITTQCCGDVVENGKSGLVVQARDVRDITDSLLRFVEDPDLLQQMSQDAITRSHDFTPDAIWPHYADALTGESGRQSLAESVYRA